MKTQQSKISQSLRDDVNLTHGSNGKIENQKEITMESANALEHRSILSIQYEKEILKRH